MLDNRGCAYAAICCSVLLASATTACSSNRTSAASRDARSIALRSGALTRWIAGQADAIERQLAHQEANEIRGAYTMPPNSGRSVVRMMRWWADEFDRLREHGRVIKMSA